MKTGDLIKIVYPLPERGTVFTPWVKELSLSGEPVPLLEYNGKGGINQIFYNGAKRYISEDITEVVYEAR